MNKTFVEFDVDLVGRLISMRMSPTEGIEDVVCRLIETPSSTADSHALPARAEKAAQATIAAGAVRYKLFGRDCAAHDATEAYVSILKQVSQSSQISHGQDDFLERLAQAIRGRTRRHLAKNAKDVYPGQERLERYVRPLVNGWCIGTNTSNREKTSHLKAACEVAGLTYGIDLVIALPNSK